MLNLMNLKIFSIVLAFSVLLIATSAKGTMAQNATTNATNAIGNASASSAANKTGEAMQSTTNAEPIINESAEYASVKLTGPSSAGPGKNVTLIGELEGLEEDKVVSARFVQVGGANVSFSECARGSTCTFPSMTFVTPECSVNDKNLRFELSVNMTYSYVFNGTHTLKLEC